MYITDFRVPGPEGRARRNLYSPAYRSRDCAVPGRYEARECRAGISGESQESTFCLGRTVGGCSFGTPSIPASILDVGLWLRYPLGRFGSLSDRANSFGHPTTEFFYAWLLPAGLALFFFSCLERTLTPPVASEPEDARAIWCAFLGLNVAYGLFFLWERLPMEQSPSISSWVGLPLPFS